MQRYLTNVQMRAADARAIQSGVGGEELMNRAGRAIADEVCSAAAERGVKDILVVCGTGNNGGDGYVCARELLSRGYSVKVFAFDGNLSPDCLREKERYVGAYTDRICGGLIVDCIFGTGLTRALSERYAEAVGAINDSGAFVVSADIPSGINGDNGCVMGVAVRADLTVALAYPKLGCVLGDGIDTCGKVVVKDIGIVSEEGVCAYQDGDVSAFFPERRRNTHKGSYGKACLVAGSLRYPGAAVLSVASALRTGCGYVRACVDEEIKMRMFPVCPQAVYCSEPDLSADSIAVGMGAGETEEIYETVLSLLGGYRGKLILDADALNALAYRGKEALKTAKCDVLITPHLGEFSRLSGASVAQIAADPVALAKNFAEEYHITVHLKSAVSVTTDGKRTALTLRGTSALAKAGSGDMLSGLICGNAARGLDLYEAAVCSQYLLGCSAEICSERFGDYPTTAAELLNFLPIAAKRLTQRK